MIGPMLSAGLPPWGLGFYAREDALELSTRFVCIRPDRNDAQEQADAVRARGAQLWLWIGPERSRHDNFEEGLALLQARARSLGAAGVIVNPERNARTGGWMAPRSRETMGRYGAACAQLARETRVGMVTFPSHPGVEEFAQAAGGAVWGSVELYGENVPDAEGMQRWYQRFVAAFGAQRVIPSIAGWAHGPNTNTREAFRAYLARVPRAAGAIAFDAMGEMPAWMREELQSYEPGGSALGTIALALRGWLARPAGAAALAIVGALVVALVVGLRAVGHV